MSLKISHYLFCEQFQFNCKHIECKHCLEIFNAIKQAEAEKSTHNSDYAEACRAYDEYICDLDPVAPKNFRTWCEQRLNAEKQPGTAHNRKLDLLAGGGIVGCILGWIDENFN